MPAPADMAAPPLHKGPAALLHVSLEAINTGSMAAEEVVLLFLTFPEDGQLQRHSTRRPWWPRRWWQPGAAASPAANLPSVTLTLPCAGSDSSSGSGAVGGSVWPEDVPRQTLAGFERLASLAPAQSAAARFALTLATFQPFSPLDSGSHGMQGTAVRPYCGRYVLRAGGQEMEVWVADEEPSAAL